jgi:hypothetical protein
MGTCQCTGGRVGNSVAIELPHAILAVFTDALCFELSHRDSGINTPYPYPAFVLKADRADFDLHAVVFEDHALDAADKRRWDKKKGG